MDLIVFCDKCKKKVQVKIMGVEYNTPDGYCVIKYKCKECGNEGKYIMNV